MRLRLTMPARIYLSGLVFLLGVAALAVLFFFSGSRAPANTAISSVSLAESSGIATTKDVSRTALTVASAALSPTPAHISDTEAVAQWREQSGMNVIDEAAYIYTQSAGMSDSIRSEYASYSVEPLLQHQLDGLSPEFRRIAFFGFHLVLPIAQFINRDCPEKSGYLITRVAFTTSRSRLIHGWRATTGLRGGCIALPGYRPYVSQGPETSCKACPQRPAKMLSSVAIFLCRCDAIERHDEDLSSLNSFVGSKDHDRRKIEFDAFRPNNKEGADVSYLDERRGITMRALYSVIGTILFCNAAAAFGYSDEENESIWRWRLLAAELADAKSSEICSWKPETPRTFVDDLSLDEPVGNLALRKLVAKLIRHDQNARAVYDAFAGDAAAAKNAGEMLKDVDKNSLTLLKNHFDKQEFPGINDIGTGGIHALLLLVAHADSDLEFQKNVLEKMNVQVAKGNLPEMFPLVLKTIRPQIIGATVNSNSTSTTSGRERDAHETPRECYEMSYPKFFGEYMRDALTHKR